MKIKYAYIVFDLPYPFPRIETPFSFGPQISLQVETLGKQIQKEDIDHWAGWLGSLTWENLSKGEKLVLSAWMETKNPGVLDGENQKLQGIVENVFRLLPLVFPFKPPQEDCYQFTGDGHLEGGKIIPKDIRSFVEIQTWRQAFYCGKQRDPYFDWAEKQDLSAATVLEEWKEIYVNFEDIMFVQEKRQMIESFRSFEDAVKGTQLEFKIPSLVRSVESLTAPWGYKQFAQRALVSCGGIESDLPYGVSRNSTTWLEKLYQLRNDCSHGKPFAYSLSKELGKLPDDSVVAGYEFLAERVAAKSLKRAFKSKSLLAVADDFDKLSEAWNKGQVTI